MYLLSYPNLFIITTNTLVTEDVDAEIIFCLQHTGLVTHSMSIQTRTVSSPQTAEKDAFIQLMELASSDFDLSVVTTDGHLGIAAHMRTAYPHVTHNQVSDVRNFVCSYLCHVIFKNS